MTRSYSIPERLAHVVPDEATLPDVVYVMELPDGEPTALTASAAWIWYLAVEGEADVAGVLAEAVGSPREAIELDVERFLAELVDRRFLHVNET